MAKKRFGKNSNYYSNQTQVTEKNKLEKQTIHNRKHTNDTTKNKNPQLCKEEVECRYRLNSVQSLPSKRLMLVEREIKNSYKNFKKVFKLTTI